MRRRVMLVAAIALAGRSICAARGVRRRPVRFPVRRARNSKQQRQAPPQANFFADPFGTQPAARAAAARQVASGGSGPAFCVRSCDGRYFPLTRGNAIAGADVPGVLSGEPDQGVLRQQYRRRLGDDGERYADSENAFAYRKALRADCTCNGRDPAGLAPVDLTLDTSLRAGDVIATTDGLVAYSGVKVGNNQTAEFTPVASYPGPHRRGPRPARRDEGGAGARRDRSPTTIR